MEKSNNFKSREYWETRYKKGGTSGNGSYGSIAELKTSFLTDFINNHNINSIVEYGCGDCNNLALTESKNPGLKITGVDVSHTALNICKNKMPNHTFVHKDEYNPVPVDLVVSLEVIFHLIEDDVFDDYMDCITSIGAKWLIILSPDEEDDYEYAIHVRKRKYTNSKYLKERYELVKELEFNNVKCFSDWKIFKIK